MASTKPLPRCRKCGGEPILKSEPTYFWGPPQHRMFCSSCGNGSQRYCFDSEIIAIQEWKKMNQTDENEWVIITDPNHIARKCDERRCEKIAYGWSACYGLIGCRIEDFPDWQFRCRRKDLPPQAEPVKPVHPMCAAMASAAFVPLMHEQADGTICTKSGTIIVPLPDGTLHETAGYIVDLKPASSKIAPAGGPGYAGISDLVADLLTVTCPVTGEIIKLSAEGRKFFSPWMNPDGTFECKVPLVPKNGYRFLPRRVDVIQGDMWWDIQNQKWAPSDNWKKDNCSQADYPSVHGPYIRKITTAILDNGDNPNCGKVLTSPATPSAAVGASGPGAVDTDKLLPCPFCGGKAELIGISTGGPMCWSIHCSGCASEFTTRYGKFSDAWNRRAGDTVSRSEYDRVVKLNHHLREVAVMAIVERVPKDSKPRVDDEPVSGTVPRAEYDRVVQLTVSPEVGKRYVCRNGEVTKPMRRVGLKGYCFVAEVGQKEISRSWTEAGRHDTYQHGPQPYDLIAESHEPEPHPAESPDDAVVVRHDGCTLSRPGRGDCLHFVGVPSVLDDRTTDKYGIPHGWCLCCWQGWKLERITEALHRYATNYGGESHAESVVCEALSQSAEVVILPPVPVVPKTRTVTLREFSIGERSPTVWGEMPQNHWSSPTGRMFDVEVPE